MDKETKRYFLEGNTYPIREELKSRGFQWDPEANQWWHSKRAVAREAQQLVPPEPQKHYIEGAEFSDREKLKELGARWDPGPVAGITPIPTSLVRHKPLWTPPTISTFSKATPARSLRSKSN